MKLLHLTDTHLDHLEIPAIQRFCRTLVAAKPDVVVITGDISNANMLFEHLLVVRKELAPVPVFFVAGNHDYYHGSIQTVRDKLIKFCTYTGPAKIFPAGEGSWWLGNSGVIHLSDTHALIGSDGWYDGLYADWFKSQLDMNDYYLIEELSGAASCPTRQHRFDALQRLSAASADYVRVQLQAAFDSGYKTVFVATHVPPFAESATYRGKISDSTWLPHFSSKKMGEALTQVMLANPEKDKLAIVLCGHTHGASTYRALHNLVVHTGAAEYGAPSISNKFNY